MGKSGSGKSTLLRAIAGLLPGKEGLLTVDGHAAPDVGAQRAEQFAEGRIDVCRFHEAVPAPAAMVVKAAVHAEMRKVHALSSAAWTLALSLVTAAVTGAVPGPQARITCSGSAPRWPSPPCCRRCRRRWRR
ncbi:MAG: ATP-binding cassette domain-containing protein [Burkholderiales bacterium]